MFIELAVGAGIVLLGALAVRRAKRREAAAALDSGETKKDSAPDEEIESSLDQLKKRADKETESKATDQGDRARPESPRGLRVGDVLLYADTELWLAGEVHLDEEGFALSLFIAPGAARATHIVQLDAEARDVAFLSVTDEVPGGAVPTELPIEGLRLKLRRRGHADVRTEGEHLPRTTERADYVILGGPGGKTLVVVDFDAGDRLALHGEILGREMYDLLPGGDVD
jgi:hypothetical protein